MTSAQNLAATNACAGSRPRKNTLHWTYAARNEPHAFPSGPACLTTLILGVVITWSGNYLEPCDTKFVGKTHKIGSPAESRGFQTKPCILAVHRDPCFDQQVSIHPQKSIALVHKRLQHRSSLFTNQAWGGHTSGASQMQVLPTEVGPSAIMLSTRYTQPLTIHTATRFPVRSFWQVQEYSTQQVVVDFQNGVSSRSKDHFLLQALYVQNSPIGNSKHKK